MTNSRKLKGRIVEMGYTLSSFSDALKMSRPCFRKKIQGLSDFKAKEIEKICNLLAISHDEIVEYFFNPEVPDLDTREETNLQKE